MARSDNPPTSGLLRWLPFRLDRGVGVAVGAGVVLALTGAFGTDIVPLWLRVAYWVPLILAGAVWAHLCSRLIEPLVDPDERLVVHHRRGEGGSIARRVLEHGELVLDPPGLTLRLGDLFPAE